MRPRRGWKCSRQTARRRACCPIRSRAIGSEELAAALAEKGVAVRAGLHCAPLAHESAGTIEGGTVRFSFSPFNNAREVERAAAALAGILKMSPQGR